MPQAVCFSIYYTNLLSIDTYIAVIDRSGGGRTDIYC